MENTLYDALIRRLDKNPIRFHMPGHKGRDILGVRHAFEIDFTELDGLDNLHFPKGCIARSEELAAKLFGARRTFFLVNGSSCGIIAAALAFAAEGERLVCARNSHISVYKALCLSGAIPVYAAPEIIPQYGVCGGISPESVETALRANKDAKAVFVVSPTYEGITSDIEAIADITHKHGALLLVDEAHGSHFAFGSVFPKTALSQGADVVVQSWHKTLSALGQGAALHLNGGLHGEERLRQYLSIMQSTSPSYPILASLDRTRELLQYNGAEYFSRYERNLKYLREGLARLGCPSLLSAGITGANSVAGLDAGKVVLYAKDEGEALDEHLRRTGIFAEMRRRDYVLLMTSFMDKREDYGELLKAVSSFKPKKRGGTAAGCRESSIYREIPEAALTPKECLARPSALVPIHKAAGRICARFITPYPPGTPIAAPGEVITEKIVAYCLEYGDKYELNGVAEGKYVSVLE